MTATANYPQQGAVLRYPYLWARERDAGESAGRKPRPVCLVLRISDAASAIHHLVLLPITSQAPSYDRVALEIPDIERRRAGLTRYARAWVIADEYNYDIAEQSFHLEPDAQIGTFGAKFLREIAKALRSTLTKTAARVDRTAD
jgi:hypothetical protein